MVWKSECCLCQKKMTFNDVRDISQAHWKIIAWIVPDGSPRVVCNKCNYPVNIIKKKYEDN